MDANGNHIEVKSRRYISKNIQFQDQFLLGLFISTNIKNIITIDVAHLNQVVR